MASPKDRIQDNNNIVVSGSAEPTVAGSKTASLKSVAIGSEKEEVITPGGAVRKRSNLRAVVVVLTVTTAMMVNVGNATAVSIAVPTMAREWGLEEAEVQWPVAAYPLSSGCLLLAFGRIADLYGRKKTFVLGSVFLAIFTLACGFANNVITLDILRGVQGIGAAATIPAALGILAHEFAPGRSRSLAFATFSAGAPLGGVFGSVLGGIMTDRTWRSPFYLMTGFTALSALGGILSISPDRKENLAEDKRMDWLGSFLASAGLVLIVFVLGQGELAPGGWATGYIIGLLITGVVLLVAFLFWQHRLEKIQKDPLLQGTKSWTSPPPIMTISLWKRADGKFAAMMVIAFVNWCAFLSWTFWAQLYYQNYMKYTVMQTVVRFLPMAVSGVVCNCFVGLMAARVPVVFLAAFGTSATGGACLLFALIDPTKSYWSYGFPAAIITVMGADFVFSAGTLYIAKVVGGHEQSVAGAVFNVMISLGTAVGVTVSTIAFNRIRDRDPGADLLGAYHAANWVGFGFGVIGMVLSILFFRNVGVVGDRRAKAAAVEDGAGTPSSAELDEKKEAI